MIISIKHIGSVNGGAAKLIEMTVDNYGVVITQDITNLKGEVDVSLITAMREIADELEDQNRLLTLVKRN